MKETVSFLAFKEIYFVCFFFCLSHKAVNTHLTEDALDILLSLARFAL